jgi:autotransporter-associated beta strand protein
VLNKNIVSNGGRLLNDAGVNGAGGERDAGGREHAGGDDRREFDTDRAGERDGRNREERDGGPDPARSNSYTGSTIVNVNFLRGNVDGLQGVFVINATGNGTGVVYQNSADGSSRATFTGPGNLLAGTGLGTNVVTLATANTYDGFTALNAGVFRVTHPLALGSTLNGTYVDGGTRVGHIDLAGDITVLTSTSARSGGRAGTTRRTC